MIVSHKYALIFITTPKSGSHTGFKLLKEYFEAEPTPFNHAKVAPKLNGYTTFTFVRNPYERFCALYHACVVNDKKKWVPAKARESIEAYAKWYASGPRVRPDLTSSQTDWHKGTNVEYFVQIEKAQEHFNTLYPKLDIVMPHELKRNHPTWEDVRNDTLIEHINKWAGNDFKQYGYKAENCNS